MGFIHSLICEATSPENNNLWLATKKGEEKMARAGSLNLESNSHSSKSSGPSVFGKLVLF